MASSFKPISALIEVDFPWREADVRILRHPSAHEPQYSRILFHESVHYWQQLGQGFMGKVAGEDWGRLLNFEARDALDETGPLRKEFARRHEVGFSAQDLHESLARFWDVHAIGPHQLLEMDFGDPKRDIDDSLKHQYFAFKEKGLIVDPLHGGYSGLAFDMAMEASAGNYAMPYKFVRERCDPVVAGAVFPLAGHCALQADTPVDLFIQVIEAAPRRFENLPRGHAIEELWRACYSGVRTLSVRAARELGIGTLTMGPAAIRHTSLAQHPVYRWAFGELERGRMVLDDTPLAEAMARAWGELPQELLRSGVRGAMALDMCLSCPGDTTLRSFLIGWLAPPCVRFPGGNHWSLTEFYRRQLVPEMDDVEAELSEERRRAAADVLDVNERWLRFRRAVRGY